MKTKETAVKKLKIALRSNAVFSATSAIFFAGFAERIATITGISSALGIQIIGLNLLGFAILLTVITKGKDWSFKPVLIWGIVAADYIWVFASFVGLVLWSEFLTQIGVYLVIAIAIIVGLIATFQTRYLLKVV